VLKTDKWVLLTEEQQRVYDHMFSVSVKLQEEAVPFNGVQTSKNQLYIIDKWTDNGKTITFTKKGQDYTVEKSILKPYLKTERNDLFSSFETIQPNAYLLFPYKVVKGHPVLYSNTEMKKKFPLAWDYLSTFKTELLDRDIQPELTNKSEWYRFGRHQSLTIFENRPKIIVGVLFFKDRYVYDTADIYFSSGGTAGYCGIYMKEESDYSPYYIMGLLNSGPVEWIATLLGDVFQGDCYAHGTDVLKRLPIRKIDFQDKKEKKKHDEICDIVKQVISLKKQRKQASQARDIQQIERGITHARKKLEEAVIRLYGIEALVEVIPK